MKIHHLKPAAGSNTPKTRRGRGASSGKGGHSAGRGTKGTGARDRVPAYFEGGQMPLQRRLPKLPGFKPRQRVTYQTVNVARLDSEFENGEAVTPEVLRARGLVRRGTQPVKVLGQGELNKELTVSAHAFSESAREKISASGGSVEVLPRSSK